MSDKERPEPDPTAEFLADVRPEETPWRRERPPGEAAPEENQGQTTTWRQALGRASTGLTAASAVGWVASSALNEEYDEGYDQGYDAGFDAGAGA